MSLGGVAVGAKSQSRCTQGFLPKDLFHSTNLATWGSSGVSIGAKFFKELTFLEFVCYFSAKIEQYSKTSKTELKMPILGGFLKFAQFWLEISARNKK